MSVAAPRVAGVSLGQLAARWNCSRREVETFVLGREGFVELGILDAGELDDNGVRRYRLTDRGARIARAVLEFELDEDEDS